MKPGQLTIVVALLAFLLGAPLPALAGLVPGADVDISNIAGAQSEVGIAVNPTNPMNLVAVSNNIADLSRLGTWYSINGGANWIPNFLDENEDGFGANDTRFDPNVAFDSDGNVYVVYSTTGTGNRLLLARSTDGGQNFNLVTTVTTDAPAASNLHTAMVTTRSDPAGADDVLVVWARVAGAGESIQAALSLDAGVTFPTVNNNINDALQRTFLPWATADAAGNFHVVWEVNQGGGVGVVLHDFLNGVTLADGANNTVTTIQITDFAAATSKIPAQPDRGLFSVTTVEADRSTGRVYVSYTDRPNTASNDTDIYLRFSDDSGVNWSNRIQINDDATTTSQFMPRMALDQTTGAVCATWYDARNDAANNQQVDVYTSASLDGGLTWFPNQQVTTARSDESTANAARNGNNYGEYFGLIAHDGIAHAVWTDARAANFALGTNEEVYTASIVLTFQPSIDIKFCSNPNGFNSRRTRGVVPLTIFGGEEGLDVGDIDISTLQLCADGAGCTGAPVSWSFADRGDPASDLGASMCAIVDDTEQDFLNPDGFVDLDVAFAAAEVCGVIGCGGLGKGDTSDELMISGFTMDGVPIMSGNTDILDIKR